MSHESEVRQHACSHLSLEDVPDRLPLLTYVMELPGRQLRYVNPRVKDLLGYAPDELQQEGLAFFESNSHPDDRARIRSAEQRYEVAGDEEHLVIEGRVKHCNGRWRWIRRCEVIFARLADGRPSKVLGIAEDITERKSSERHLVRDQERMLHLLAYDIHDGFVQDVVGAQMALESIIEMIGAGNADCMQELVLLRGLLRKAIGEGRRMISELRPMILDEMGIVEAIHYLVAEEEAAGRLQIKFSHDVQFERLAPMLEGTVFRITQEALNNVRRHAGVEEAEVRLRQVESRLVLEIEDRGKGFETAAIKDHHYGLEGIYERAKIFGGQADIQSAPGNGTRISVSLPLQLPPGWHVLEQSDEDAESI